MKPLAYNPQLDLPPMLFDVVICDLAAKLKGHGLVWQPHVGCFVWDPNKNIKADSPFPLRIFFILNLQRFIDIFGSIQEIADKLVWLPTWHQARLICQQLKISDQAVAKIIQNNQPLSLDREIISIYELILDALKRNHHDQRL